MNLPFGSKRASLPLLVLLVLTAWGRPLLAQGDPNFTEDSKLNSNLGAVAIVPLNPTAKYVNVGWGLLLGGGYNFTKRNGLVFEFMWDRLYPTVAALAPIRQAAANNNIDGHANLYTVTANYRYELRGKKLGVYFIGGGGWFHRNASLSQTVQANTPTVCTPIWMWWGYSCTSGTVTSTQKLEIASSDALGGNGGIGVTIKVGEPRYRVYVESRYYYAHNDTVNTELIPITVGFRF
jgi:hypothetical protein